jgi:hypothetical protein
MMTFLKANIGLVSTPIDAAIRRSHRELFRDTTGLTIGMNWIRSFDDELAQNIIWHNGGTGGFQTYLGFTEDRQFGVFVLGNTANRPVNRVWQRFATKWAIAASEPGITVPCDCPFQPNADIPGVPGL